MLASAASCAGTFGAGTVRRRGTGPLLVFVLLVGLHPLGAAPDSHELRYVLDRKQSSIEFVADSRFGKVSGSFARWHYSGTIGADLHPSGKVVVETASLSTGNSMRDDHLRSVDFFDAAVHPKATFEIVSVEHSGPVRALKGRLNIRGKSVPLTISFKQQEKGGVLRLSGVASVSRRIFGMNYDSVINPIADLVTIKVAVVLRRAD